MKENKIPDNSIERRPLILKFGKNDAWPETTLPVKGDRPPMAPAEKERWDRKLGTLGKLMTGAGAWWQLDGALNISLRNIGAGGDYIGEHGDVDLSLFADELPKFKAYAETQGYGLFYYTKDKSTGEKTFTEVIDEDAKPRKDAKLRLLLIDHKTRKMRTDADLPIAGIVPYYRDRQGQFIAQYRGLVLPEKWLRGETMPFRDTRLVLSHPARFTLHKLFYLDKAEYHQKDLERFVVDMRALSEEDFEDIREVLLCSLDKLGQGRKEMEEYSHFLATRALGLVDAETTYQVIHSDMQDFYRRSYGILASRDPGWVDEEIRKIANGISKLTEKSDRSISSLLLSFGGFGEDEEKQIHSILDNLERLRQQARVEKTN